MSVAPENTYKRILRLIDEKIVTCGDFDLLIAESSEKSTRERVHRKMRRNPTATHIKRRTGHSPFSVGKFSVAKRTHPKLRPTGQMEHGESEAAHDRSTKTQRKNAGTDKRPVEMLE